MRRSTTGRQTELAARGGDREITHVAQADTLRVAFASDDNGPTAAVERADRVRDGGERRGPAADGRIRPVGET